MARKPETGRLGIGAHLANIWRLTIKELRSIRADPVMLILVVYAFSINVYTVATGASVEANNLAVAIVDEDRSALSRRIADGLTPPLFRPAVEIAATAIDGEMDAARYVFVVEIPPRFEADVLAGRTTTVQVNVDATAITQAGNGAAYLQTVILNEVAAFKAGRDGVSTNPVDVVIRANSNPNLKSSWFTSVMQVINSITMLTVILTGAALIREREQGTVEHLLVMPVVASEIMLAKILANGLVTLVAAGLSLVLVVEWWLQVPIAGSILLFLGGAAVYVFTVAALGILLGTIANTMGQFGLLAIPVLLVTMLLSGSATPIESMPVWLRWIVWIISPTPHFVSFAQAVLYRGAGFMTASPPLIAVAAIGGVYLAAALRRFRRVVLGG
ncbi:ABC transporter permease [Rhodoplanes sp.]|uniref:ABC transporter permease n=1 Tax=Rhodoplanes sp. TaxID=1968906 RepID=UPI0025F5DF1A|nr:ABC transporter permease [Rhodoplanes sp.]